MFVINCTTSSKQALDCHNNLFAPELGGRNEDELVHMRVVKVKSR